MQKVNTYLQDEDEVSEDESGQTGERELTETEKASMCCNLGIVVNAYFRKLESKKMFAIF